ncbi:MAG: prolipoprotein diacylglyceryl transferase [Anaerovoracaceae bacterium]
MNTAPNPIAFEIFNLEIRWYGIILAIAFATAIFIAYKRAKGHRINKDQFLDIAIISTLSGLIGARLYYVIFNWSDYEGDLLGIINTREGGLAVHGGLILGIFAAFIVCKYKRISFLNLLDLAAPSIAIGQAIGRWGNFFNSEAHGGLTDLPWAILVDGQSVHPTFLYESIWCLLIFIVLIIIDNKRKFDGQIILLYGILYSAERIFVEALRTDSLMIGPIKQAQLISAVIIVVCSILYFLLLNERRKR